MKNAPEHAKRLSQLLSRLDQQVAPAEPDELDPLRQMIHAFLVWEASRNQADQAYARLMRETVDLNDLRVSDPHEVAEVIGKRYALAEERCYRLHRALHDVYRREHAVDLARLRDVTKRDARNYLDGLEGMVPFVSASVCLLSLNAHALPADEQLRERLARDGVVDEDAPLEEVQSFLEHNILADDALNAYHRLRAYVERPIKVDLGKPPGRTEKKRPSRGKTTRKTRSG